MKQNNSIFIVVIAAVLLVPIVLVLAVAVLNLKGEGNSPAPRLNQSAEKLLDTPAPAFSLKDEQGKIISSESLKGKKTVLFFNEGLRCYPACWNAMTALAQDPRFNGNDVQAFSVVVDNASEWRRASAQVPELQKVRVLFDTNKSVSAAFGMLSLPSSMHRGSLPGHTYVIVDEAGVIRWLFDDPRMGIRNDQVAEELKQWNREP